MATFFSILAWRIPWTEEPGRLQSVGSQKSRTQLTPSNNTGLLVLDLYSFPVYTTELPEEHYSSIFKKQ